MKETLRIVMPWFGGCLGTLLLLFFVLAYLLDDGRQALCDKAVEKAMKDKPAYKLLEIIPGEQEEPTEGRAISTFKYIYRYYPTDVRSNLHVGVLECDYVDGNRNPVDIHSVKEIDRLAQ